MPAVVGVSLVALVTTQLVYGNWLVIPVMICGTAAVIKTVWFS